MAESKVKPAAKVPPSKTSKDSKLWSLICLAREVGGDADGIQNYAHLVNEKQRLEGELGDRIKEALRLNGELAQEKSAAARERTLLTHTFGEQYKIFHENKVILETQRGRMEELQAELKTIKDRDITLQKQVANLEFNLNSANNAHNRLQKKTETMERDCIIHRSQLQAAQAERDNLRMKLIQARGDLGFGFFHDVDETRELRLREQLNSLAAVYHTIVKSFMSDPEAARTCSPLLQSLQSCFPDLPLSTGATKEAILMRRAAGQAVICEALSEYIFRPFYVPHVFKQAADQMLGFFEEEKELQQVYRHQVTKFQDDPELEAVVDAGGHIMRLLDRLVLPENVQEFHRRVDEFLRRAAHAWVHEAQPSSDLIQVTLPKGDDEHLESYPEFGVRNAGKVGTGNHTIVATLFPRITISGKMLHGGKVLWSDSPATIIARDQNPSPTLGRTGTLRKNGRRNSVTGRPTT